MDARLREGIDLTWEACPGADVFPFFWLRADYSLAGFEVGLDALSKPLYSPYAQRQLAIAPERRARES